MVDQETIAHWLAGEAPTAAQVEELALSAPTFLLPAAMRLRNGKDVSQEERAALSARLAIGAPDLEQMSMAADADLEIDLAQFYPRELPATPGTADTIEMFLNTYSTPDPKEEELLERLIFNPTPDYAQLLAQEEEQSVPEQAEAPAGSQDDLINSFIIKQKQQAGQVPAPPPAEKPKPEAPVQKPTPTDDGLLTESLAKIYIRRGNYAKAYEIINGLNLNFPEKSVYFADQLRFLKKLIDIQEQTKQTNTEK